MGAGHAQKLLSRQASGAAVRLPGTLQQCSAACSPGRAVDSSAAACRPAGQLPPSVAAWPKLAGMARLHATTRLEPVISKLVKLLEFQAHRRR